MLERAARRRRTKSTAVISLQNIDRTRRVLRERPVRLLTTLAGSLSVALENARLVHETRQRNAELALINSVQAAIAGELDPQAIYDLVGDRIQEIFDAQVVDIAIFDFEAEAQRTSRTSSSRASRLPGRARPAVLTRRTGTDRDQGAGADQRRVGLRRPSSDGNSVVHRRRAAALDPDRPARLGGRGPRAHLAPERRPDERVLGERRRACCRRSPAASASRSRTRGSSTRPGSGTPSWR